MKNLKNLKRPDKTVKYLYCIITLTLLTACSAIDYNTFGAIEGEVRGQSDYNALGISLAGASVTLSKEGTVLKSPLTKSDGKFEFQNLDAGKYTLSVSKAKYQTITETVNVYGGETTPISVMLHKESSEDPITATGIKGRIQTLFQSEWGSSDSYLISVEDALVELRDNDNALRESMFTDDFGNFEFSGLAEGLYTVTVQKHEYITEEERVNVTNGKYTEISIILSLQ
jgi:hypothetical protein